MLFLKLLVLVAVLWRTWLSSPLTLLLLLVAVLLYYTVQQKLQAKEKGSFMQRPCLTHEGALHYASQRVLRTERTKSVVTRRSKKTKAL